MNARTWFYSQSFNGRVDRSSYATQSDIEKPQICPLCHKAVDMGVHTWCKLDGKIAHDYCARTRS